jgi:hypothetical protein
MNRHTEHTHTQNTLTEHAHTEHTHIHTYIHTNYTNKCVCARAQAPKQQLQQHPQPTTRRQSAKRRPTTPQTCSPHRYLLHARMLRVTPAVVTRRSCPAAWGKPLQVCVCMCVCACYVCVVCVVCVCVCYRTVNFLCVHRLPSSACAQTAPMHSVLVFLPPAVCSDCHHPPVHRLHLCALCVEIRFLLCAQIATISLCTDCTYALCVWKSAFCCVLRLPSSACAQTAPIRSVLVFLPPAVCSDCHHPHVHRLHLCALCVEIRFLLCAQIAIIRMCTDCTYALCA